MPTARQIGTHFENLACQFLTAQNLTIITRNYNVAKVGEIDIIAVHQVIQKNGTIRPTLVFVEVKARKNSQFAKACETITAKKQQNLIKTAEHFLQMNEVYANFDFRFDVVAFQVDERQRIYTDWQQGAFWVE